MGYHEDILNQPKALAATLDAAAQPPVIIAKTGSDFLRGGLKRLVLTGMGSSLYAQQPLYLKLLSAGLPVTLIETSELIHHAQALLAPHTCVLAVSQSGRSAEIVHLLEKHTGRLLAVCNDANSPLAQAAHGLLLTQAGEEHTVSCKTYVASLAALELMGEALLGRPVEPRLAELRAVLPLVEHFLSGWQRHVADFQQLLVGVQNVIYAGRGASLAAALTAGLTTKESTRSPAEGMSSAAFRHGPLEMVSEKLFVLVFEGDEPTRRLNRRLVDEINALGGRACLVGPSAQVAATHLPEVPAAARPILEMLPVQMLTLALAGLHGHKAGEFSQATKVTGIE
ncbi:MAG TPA: SIS domain-containing protein [Levilinea sp.]|nr:SIS domain-containing protein [Levilinea sp.]